MADPIMKLVGRRVAKSFPDFENPTQITVYYGTVSILPDLEPPYYYHVTYDDGDTEDYTRKQLQKILLPLDKKNAFKAQTPKKPDVKPGAKRKLLPQLSARTTTQKLASQSKNDSPFSQKIERDRRAAKLKSQLDSDAPTPNSLQTRLQTQNSALIPNRNPALTPNSLEKVLQPSLQKDLSVLPAGVTHIRDLTPSAAMPYPIGPHVVNVPALRPDGASNACLTPGGWKGKAEAVGSGGLLSSKRVGVNAELIELYFRFLHRRQLLRFARALPQDYFEPTVQMMPWNILSEDPKVFSLEEPSSSVSAECQLDEMAVDYVFGCTSTGNVYRHLDSGTQRLGYAMRAKVWPLIEAVTMHPTATKAKAEMAVEVLSRCVRMAVLDMAVGRLETFTEWTDQCRLPLLPSEEGCPGRQPHRPATDEELDSFMAFLKKRAACKTPPLTFTFAYQNIGFARTIQLGQSLKDNSRKLSQHLQQCGRWEEGVNAVMAALQGAGPYFGGQGLCNVWHGAIQGDPTSDHAPGCLRQLLMPHMDPASLAEYATPGNGPQKSLKAMFGVRLEGSDVEQMRWLAGQARGCFDWLGLNFPWLQASSSIPEAASEAIKGFRRELTVVDIEHSLCYFWRYATARERMGWHVAPLYRALRAVGGRIHLSLLERLEPKNVCGTLIRWLQRLNEALGGVTDTPEEPGLFEGDLKQQSAEALSEQVAQAAFRYKAIMPQAALHEIVKELKQESQFRGIYPNGSRCTFEGLACTSMSSPRKRDDDSQVEDYSLLFNI